MIDFGKYTATVLWAYGGSLALILAIVSLSLWQYRRARRAVEEAEDA